MRFLCLAAAGLWGAGHHSYKVGQLSQFNDNALLLSIRYFTFISGQAK
jgi:hypothetical protein